MNAAKDDKKFLQLGRALNRLGEALAAPADHDMRIDALIQRFEFTIELYWKVLKIFLENEQVEARSPLSVFKEAYYIGWLGDDDAPWVAMLKDRNLSSHTYDEELANQVVDRIPAYYPLLRETYERLGKHDLP